MRKDIFQRRLKELSEAIEKIEQQKAPPPPAYLFIRERRFQADHYRKTGRIATPQEIKNLNLGAPSTFLIHGSRVVIIPNDMKSSQASIIFSELVAAHDRFSNENRTPELSPGWKKVFDFFGSRLEHQEDSEIMNESLNAILTKYAILP